MKKTCLVIDDSKMIRKLVQTMLEELGFEVRGAEDGLVALAEAKKGLPDLIMLDWNMPVMDGLSFLKEFKALPNSENTKVIFCTTENELEKIQAAITQGADEYIMKPFDKDILKDKLMQTGILS